MNTKVFKKASYRNLFLLLSVVIFLFLGLVLYALNLVPKELGSSDDVSNVAPEEQNSASTSTEEAYVADVLPTRIYIASVGIDTTVNHPTSQSVEVLDKALLSGSVYYPGSGSLTRGNAFVFGHSTGLSVVRNQAYKAFSNLKNVEAGDEIRVYGTDGNIYVYSAVSTELVIEDTALVEFDTTERMITLSTCNTFGKKEERHVVKAVFSRIETSL